jgi:predicted nucleotidyltransferase
MRRALCTGLGVSAVTTKRHAMIHTSPLPDGTADRLATLGQALEACPDVVFAYLFGTAARGPLQPLSDVDVAVFLDERVDAGAGGRAVFQVVSAHLKTDEVDVIVLNTAPVAVVGRILAGRHVLCDRDPFRRQRFESRALREFCDFRTFERQHLARRFGNGRP